MADNKLQIMAEKFKKTDKTDAVLLVEGRKMHVNKGLLSYHSDFFKALFESKLNEKNKSEFEIQDCKFRHVAVVLSMVQAEPIMPDKSELDQYMVLIDRFLIPTAKRQLDIMLTALFKAKKPQCINECIVVADKYGLEHTLDWLIDRFNIKDNYLKQLGNVSVPTKARLFDCFLSQMWKS